VIEGVAGLIEGVAGVIEGVAAMRWDTAVHRDA
jgi:hypothetical protein